MKTVPKRIKIEFGLLLAAIALLLIYILVIQDRGDIKYTLPTLPVLDTASIDKITVTQAGNGTEETEETENGRKVEIVRSRSNKNGNDDSSTGDKGFWLLANIDKPIDSEKIEKILGALSDLTPVDMISERGNYSAYGLDNDSKKTLTVFGAGEVLLTLEVGNLSASQSYSYIQIPGKREVYSFRGDLASLLAQTSEELRDKRIFGFKKEDLKSLSVVDGRNLERNIILKPSIKGWADQREREYSVDQLDQLLFFSSDFICDAYSDKDVTGQAPFLIIRFDLGLSGSKEGNTVAHNSEVSDLDGAAVTIRVYKEENHRYLCTSSTLQESFYVSPFVINLFVDLLEEGLK